MIRGLQSLMTTILKALEPHRSQVRAVLLAHGFTNPKIFGSVARQEDTESSDLDLLVTFPNQPRLATIVNVRKQIEAMVGVSVELVNPARLHAHVTKTVLREAVVL